MLFAGGAGLPLLMFGLLYYYRMIGAGDIKLLCAAGGYMGPMGCLSCMVSAILFGGVIAIWIMIRRRNFVQRMYYFLQYIGECSEKGQWRSYLSGTQESAEFCFSIPVLLGVLWYIGGII